MSGTQGETFSSDLRGITITIIKGLVVALALVGTASARDAFETPASLSAAAVAPSGLLSGPHYKVAPEARLDGYLPVFTIESDFGTFPAVGVEMLRVRVSEVPAIASLGEVSKSDAFANAVAKSAMAPVDFAKNLATDPGRTTASVVNGVGQMFTSAGRTIKQGAQYVQDKTADGTNGKSSNSASSRGGFTDDPLGYNKAKRAWAKKLGVDPYSTNSVLQDKLSAVAQATFVGNLSTGIAVGAVIGPAQYAVDFDTTTRDAVWDLSPGDLEAMNEKKLVAMGITGRPARDFFRTVWFTPTLSTALVSALDELPAARGRAAVIAAAPSVQSEVQARFMVNAMRLLGSYNKRGDRIVEVRMSRRVPFGVTQSGGVVVPVAIDYVGWTKEVGDFLGRKELASSTHILLTTGKASDMAKRQLATRGWRVEEVALSAR